MSPKDAAPRLSSRLLVENAGLPMLVLGPSLGTTTALWEPVAELLADQFEVLAYDLPGHGASPPTTTPYEVGTVADGVLGLVDDRQAARGDQGRPFFYAGDSFGGAVALQLLLSAPHRVAAAVVMASAARIGEPAGWHERADLVRSSGTTAVVDGSRQRWFAPGFVDREPAIANALLDALVEVDDESYALACDALARFDVRDRLGDVRSPVLAVAGVHDPVTTSDDLATVADGVPEGRLIVLDDVSHLPPAEAPTRVASLIAGFLSGFTTARQTYAAGMTVRRAVLGEAHVDRTTASIDATTREFQELITRYAWGSVWTRPGLDRRSRSIVTITALVAQGHWTELALHLRAGLRNGLTREELVEVLLQCAIYCSVPAANTAFRIAQEVFELADGPETFETTEEEPRSRLPDLDDGQE